jgi:hypothetical protein
MRGKIAKQLRKFADFVPSEKREYHKLLMPTEKFITQFNSITKEIKHVKRKVESELIECVSAKRKLYKFLKKKYINNNAEATFNRLPTKEQMHELKNTVAQDLQRTKEGIPTTTSGELLSTSSTSGPETI